MRLSVSTEATTDTKPESVQLVRHLLTMFSTRLFVLAVVLVSSIVLARALGPEGRGIFALVLLLTEFSTNLGHLGFVQANAVYAGLEPHRREALAWHSLVMAVAVGGALAVASLVFVFLGAPGFPGLVRGPLWLYVLPLATIPARLASEYWGAILHGLNRLVILNLVEAGMKAALLALVVALVWGLRRDVAGAVWADALIPVAMVVVLAVLLRRLGMLGRPAFDRSLWRQTTRFALPIHAANLMAYVTARLDHVLVAAWCPPEQLGLYVIAVGLAERLLLLTGGSVAKVLLPHLIRAPTHHGALPAAVARHVVVWMGVACLLGFVWADEMVRVLYSSTFADAAAPLRWLLPGIVIASVGKVLTPGLHARQNGNHAIGVRALAALVTLTGNLMLIPAMGIAGAALTATLSYAAVSISVTCSYVRVAGLRWTALVPCANDLRAYGALWAHGVAFVSRLWGTLSHVSPSPQASVNVPQTSANCVEARRRSLTVAG